MKKNFENYLFYLIPILILITNFFKWSTGEFITPDSRWYFKIAEGFPNLQTTTFPIFYPLVLKAADFFFNNLEITYKVVSSFALLFSFLYVRIKNFFWKEIWTVLSFSCFLNLYPYAWSEILIIPLLLIISSVNYSYLTDSSKNYSKRIYLIFVCTLTLVTMCITKYNSLFFIIGLGLFALLNYKNKIVLKTYLSIALLSFACVGLYALNNYLQMGSLFGNRNGVNANGRYDLNTSLMNIVVVLNPFYQKVHGTLFYIPKYFYSIGFGFVHLVIGLTIIFKSYQKVKENSIVSFFLCLSITFLALTIYSYLTTTLDPLNNRLLLGYYFFFYISVIASFKQLYPKKSYPLLLVGIGLFSIILFNWLN